MSHVCIFFIYVFIYVHQISSLNITIQYRHLAFGPSFGPEQPISRLPLLKSNRSRLDIKLSFSFQRLSRLDLILLRTDALRTTKYETLHETLHAHITLHLFHFRALTFLGALPGDNWYSKVSLAIERSYGSTVLCYRPSTSLRQITKGKEFHQSDSTTFNMHHGVSIIPEDHSWKDLERSATCVI